MPYGGLNDERCLLLECSSSALADITTHLSQLIAKCMGAVVRLARFTDQPLVSEYMIACPYRSCANLRQTLFPSFICWLPRPSNFSYFLPDDTADVQQPLLCANWAE